MKILLAQWGEVGAPELYQVAAELQKAGHTIVYWVVVDPTPSSIIAQFPGVIFHRHGAALYGRPADRVDASGFPPPGEDLLRELYETESTILTMMNKLLWRLSLSERKHLYYELVRYWSGILRRYAPELIVFPLVPHTVYDLVIYALAKKSGIQTLMFTATQDFVRLLPMNEYEKGHRLLRDEMEKQRGRQFLLEDVRADIRNYYRKHTEFRADPTPPNMKNLRERYGAKRKDIILRALKDFSFFPKVVRYIKKRFGPNPSAEYRTIESPPDFSKKFVYVPLQYQPEATTSPLAGVFVDQRLLVETLAAALPDGWFLYVKEHPRQFVFNGLNFSSYRYLGYYAGIARIKNVRVVPTETDTFALINHAQAVALNTGTAGLEAVLRLKPVLVFGYAWYRDCPGMFVVRDTDSCRQAFRNIQSGFLPNCNSLVHFFACVDRVSFPGYVEPHMKKPSGISEAENVANLTEAILAELKIKATL